MKSDLRKKNPIRMSEPGRFCYPPYYATHFLLLKQYVLEGKIERSFTDGDFRDLLRDDCTDDSTSRYVKASLAFFCREDIGICTYDNTKRMYVLNVSAKKFRKKSFKNLRVYIKHNGIDYMKPRGKPDRRTLEEKLSSLPEYPTPENPQSPGKPSKEGSMGKAFAESVMNH